MVFYWHYYNRSYKDIETESLCEIDFVPGGSGQNAMRAAAWILGQPNVCTFMGCVGKDKNAEIMREKASEVGLKTLYQINEQVSTGTCAVLITGKDRSLVAHLSAADKFTVDHLNNEQNWSQVAQAQFFYITGFFFTVCPEAIQRFAQFAHDNARTFSINLSAPFISEFFKDRLSVIVPYVDVVFGNDDEAKAFAKHVLQLETSDVHEIARAIANMPKLNKDKKRLVVITQGDKPVVLVHGDHLKEYPVQSLPQEKILDTNGAGDSFVGGFLSQYIQGKDLDKCVDCGVWISSLVIQRSGCTFPEDAKYE